MKENEGAMYHHSIYDHANNVPSYWEDTASHLRSYDKPLQAVTTCDVAIIGGGFTGLSAALTLANDFSLDARVVEAGDIGWGASGRNGGFACLAATKLSIDGMVKKFGKQATQEFYKSQVGGIEFTRNLIQENHIDADICGNGNWDIAHKANRLSELKEYAEEITQLTGIKSRLFGKSDLPHSAHQSPEQFGGVFLESGFALHPLKFALGLAETAKAAGATLYPKSKVIELEKNNKGQHVLKTKHGTLIAKHLLIAANGFMPENLHKSLHGRIVPVISNILVTRPLSGEELAAQEWNTDSPLCNSRNLLFYYRKLPDNRLLFGARGDISGNERGSQKTRVWMERRFAEIFPAWATVEFDYFWRGLVCMTERMTPALGRLNEDPTFWYSYGYHANGVNTAPMSGHLMAKWIAGSNEGEQAIPAVMRGDPGKIPFPGLRKAYLQTAYWKYAFDDWR
jgi:glycine/D-amino acid oxidase-like deaminating enzyme